MGILETRSENMESQVRLCSTLRLYIAKALMASLLESLRSFPNSTFDVTIHSVDAFRTMCRMGAAGKLTSQFPCSEILCSCIFRGKYSWICDIISVALGDGERSGRVTRRDGAYIKFLTPSLTPSVNREHGWKHGWKHRHLGIFAFVDDIYSLVYIDLESVPL